MPARLTFTNIKRGGLFRWSGVLFRKMHDGKAECLFLAYTGRLHYCYFKPDDAVWEYVPRYRIVPRRIKL